jgi:CheY-like chemotaxis protein
MSPQTPVGLLLCDDLIFTSRVTGVGKDLGFHIRPASSVAMLRGLIEQHNPRCIIIDLQNPGLDIAQLAAEVKQRSPAAFLAGYGSHVDTATLKKARDAGCDVVLPRSKFVEELPAELPRWFAAASDDA